MDKDFEYILMAIPWTSQCAYKVPMSMLHEMADRL